MTRASVYLVRQYRHAHPAPSARASRGRPGAGRGAARGCATRTAAKRWAWRRTRWTSLGQLLLFAGLRQRAPTRLPRPGSVLGWRADPDDDEDLTVVRYPLKGLYSDLGGDHGRQDPGHAVCSYDRSTRRPPGLRTERDEDHASRSTQGDPRRGIPRRSHARGHERAHRRGPRGALVSETPARGSLFSDEAYVAAGARIVARRRGVSSRRRTSS